MKFIIAVLHLLCLIVQGLGMGHNCKLPVPENCLNHPSIALSKNDMYYRLSLCSEGSCLPANHREWIECSDVCEMCRTLPGSSCTSNTECEQQVDSFLNSYCTSALPSTVTQPGPTTTVTRTEIQPVVTVTRVQTTTSISTVTVTPAASGSPPSSTSSSSSNTQSGQATVNVASMGGGSPQASSSSVPRAEFALAALFGLAIIVLMAVIAGWALTYLIMRKRAKENNGIARTGFSKSFDAKKYFKNPAYEGSSDTLHPASQTELEESLSPDQKKFQKVKYDRIVIVPPSQVENGRKYDVLNRQPTFKGEDPSIMTPPQCVRNGNKLEEQNGGTPIHYSYSQLSHQSSHVENNYCTTRLAE